MPQYQDTYRNASYFSSEILEDGSTVHSCCSAYTTVAGCASLQMPMDTPHRELTGNKGNMAKWAMQVTLQETTQWLHKLPVVQPFGSEKLLLPLLCRCLFQPCHQPAWNINVKLWWKGNKEEFVQVHKPKLTMHNKLWQNISAGHKWSANQQFIVYSQWLM